MPKKKEAKGEITDEGVRSLSARISPSIKPRSAEGATASANKTIYLQKDRVLQMNKEVGAEGVCINEGNLEFTLERLRWEENDGLLKQAATLLYNLVTLHPFIEGNKRTALLATEVFLDVNGVAFKGDVDIKQIKDFLYKLASGDSTLEETLSKLQEWAR